MTEEQFDMEKKEAMKWLSDYSYDKGFYCIWYSRWIYFSKRAAE